MYHTVHFLQQCYVPSNIYGKNNPNLEPIIGRYYIIIKYTIIAQSPKHGDYTIREYRSIMLQWCVASAQQQSRY